MNQKISMIAFLMAIITFSCKNKNTFTDFKYTDKPVAITCNGLNSKLYNEALYSFEDDITNYYKRNRPNSSLSQAYSQFLRTAVFSKVKYEDMVSKHTLDVFEALKNEADLWDANNPKSHLNYSSSVIKCISENMKDSGLKTTFNALLSTNSMSPNLFGSPLTTQYRTALNDKYLATYIALDLYYANLFGIARSKIDFNKPEETVDFNQRPNKEEGNPHAGHSHE